MGFQFKLGVDFSEDSLTVGGENADIFSALAKAVGPAVEDAELGGNEGELWQGNEGEYTDEDDVAVCFTADVLAGH